MATLANNGVCIKCYRSSCLKPTLCKKGNLLCEQKTSLKIVFFEKKEKILQEDVQFVALKEREYFWKFTKLVVLIAKSHQKLK